MQIPFDGVVMQALVLLWKVWFSAVHFGVVWFGAFYANVI